MFAEQLTVDVCIALLLTACSGVHAPRDAGVDAGRDLGFDAGLDSGVDAGDDAGPPYRWFAPRLLFSDPSVHCDPPPALEMRAHTGPRPPRGTVRWTFNPSRDPTTIAALLSFGSGGLGLTGHSLLGMANGGFLTSINVNWAYLGVTGDGAFDFLTGMNGDKPDPTWLMPSTFITRPSAGTATFPNGGVLLFRDTIPGAHGAWARTTVTPSAHPGRTTGAVEWSRPAVLADGTVVWFPTDRLLMAVCADGRPRWVLEFYNEGYAHSVFAAGDGTIVLAGSTGGIHRLNSDGQVLVTRALDEVVSIGGYSDRCGVAVQTISPSGLKFFSGPDFSTVHAIPGESVPTGDCGYWAAGTRYRPDNTIGFPRPAREPTLARLELTDGSWLLISQGRATSTGSIPPGMSIVADDGTLVFDTSFGRSPVLC